MRAEVCCVCDSNPCTRPQTYTRLSVEHNFPTHCPTQLVTVVGSTFLSNTGGYYGGGAILSIGGALFVRGATFQNNIAGLGTICLSSQYLSMPRGGAIYATQSTFLRVQNSVFEVSW